MAIFNSYVKLPEGNHNLVKWSPMKCIFNAASAANTQIIACFYPVRNCTRSGFQMLTSPFDQNIFLFTEMMHMTPFAGMKSSHNVTIALAVVVVVPEVWTLRVRILSGRTSSNADRKEVYRSLCPDAIQVPMDGPAKSESPVENGGLSH